MKNWRVGKKLTFGFGLITVLAMIISAVALISTMRITAANNELYEHGVSELHDLSLLGTEINGARTQYRSIVIYSFYDNVEKANSAKDKYDAHLKAFLEGVAEIEKHADSDKAKELLAELHDVYDNQFTPSADKTIQTALADIPAHTQKDDIESLMAENSPASQRLNDIVVELCSDISDEANVIRNDGVKLSTQVTFIIIIVMAALIIGAVIIGVTITGMITKPLGPLTYFMTKAGSTGDISLNQADIDSISEYSQNQDELGKTIAGAASFVQHVSNIAKELESVSSGDLTVDVELLSDNDVMGKALRHMITELNKMFGEIQISTSHVQAESAQIAQGAQSLATGSTEQAATLQELSATIANIEEKTKSNAEKTRHAADFADNIMHNAQKGTEQMENMIAAVEEINSANRDISKVIKVIDDIAFQTNILALNAAVEAARAGDAGKGFAVVAEEVRNLAAKSADSAKETSALVSNSMEKTKLGTQIATETSASLTEIVAGINDSNRIITEIAQSSEEQSNAIEQVNIAVMGVTQVVQTNSATAEQSAAASEELSGQASVLDGLIAQFKLK